MQDLTVYISEAEYIGMYSDVYNDEWTLTIPFQGEKQEKKTRFFKPCVVWNEYPLWIETTAVKSLLTVNL